MEKTAINSVYVILHQVTYSDMDITEIKRAYFREDEAKEYCEKMNKVCKRLNAEFDYMYEEFTYKEVIMW